MAEKSREDVLLEYRAACVKYHHKPPTSPDLFQVRGEFLAAEKAVLARMAGPGEVVVPLASLHTLFASYCRYKPEPENFSVTLMPPFGAEPSWIVQAWGDVHAALLAAAPKGDAK